MRRWIGLVVASLAAVPACGDDSGGDDGGGPPDAAAADAAVVDAGAPDAMPLCIAGRFVFTDDYLDSETGVGIFDATLTELQTPTNTAQTAPNGRAILCLPSSRDSDVSFEHAEHVTVVQTVSLAASATAVVFPTGYTPANLDALYGDESQTRDTGAATVVIDVRAYPGGTVVDPLTVTIDATSGDAFTPASEPTQVWFPNVDVAAGEVTFTVAPASGLTCLGRATIPVAAGEVAFTSWSCN